MSQYHYHITPNLKCTNPCTYPKYEFIEFIFGIFIILNILKTILHERIHEPYENLISISLIPGFLVFEALGMYICSGDAVLFIFYRYSIVDVTWYFMRYIIWLYFWHFVISCIGYWLISKRVTSRRMKSVFPGTRNRRLAQITTLRGIYTINVNGEMPNWKNAKTTKTPVSPKGEKNILTRESIL